MPALDGLKVVRSPIHGYGMIALRPFQKGEIIVYGDGVVYSEDDDFDDTYALLLYTDEDEDEGDDEDEQPAPQMLMDLTDQTRWINHACEPNTEVDTSWDPGTGTASAWWIALRDIEIGEELTYDYAFSAPLAEPCACGAKRCRGVIVDENEIDQVPKKLQHLIRRPQRAAKSEKAAKAAKPEKPEKLAKKRRQGA